MNQVIRPHPGNKPGGRMTYFLPLRTWLFIIFIGKTLPLYRKTVQSANELKKDI